LGTRGLGGDGFFREGRGGETLREKPEQGEGEGGRIYACREEVKRGMYFFVERDRGIKVWRVGLLGWMSSLTESLLWKEEKKALSRKRSISKGQ